MTTWTQVLGARRLVRCCMPAHPCPLRNEHSLRGCRRTVARLLQPPNIPCEAPEHAKCLPFQHQTGGHHKVSGPAPGNTAAKCAPVRNQQGLQTRVGQFHPVVSAGYPGWCCFAHNTCGDRHMWLEFCKPGMMPVTDHQMARIYVHAVVVCLHCCWIA